MFKYYKIFLLIFLNSFYFISSLNNDLLTFWDQRLINSVYSRNEKDFLEALKHNANIDSKDVYGMTSLIYAVNNDDIYFVEKILYFKANIDLQDNYSNATPLIHACNRANENIINLLLDYKADPFIKDKYNKDCLFYATTFNLKNVVIRLIDEFKFNINSYYDSNILLSYVIKAKNVDMLKIFLEKGANVNLIDSKNNSMLMLAAKIYKDDKAISNKIANIILKNGFNNFYQVNNSNKSLISIVLKNKDDYLRTILINKITLDYAKNSNF